MAPGSSQQSARRRAGVQHADLRLASRPQGRREPDSRQAAPDAQVRRAIHGSGDRTGCRDRRGQIRDGRSDRLFAGSWSGFEGVALMSPEMMAGTGILRGVVAGILLVAFLALWVWAYSGRRRSAFEAASRL